MTEDTSTAAPAGQDQPAQAPGATIVIAWTGEGFKFAVQRGTDLTHPAAHFADWFARNTEPLVGLAASDFNLRRETAQQLQQHDQAAPEPEKDAPAPRLVSPHGGPLQ